MNTNSSNISRKIGEAINEKKIYQK